MLNNYIQICQILTLTQEDYEFFIVEYNNSAIKVQLINNKYIIPDKIEMPTLIVSWDKTKQLFPQQKTTNKKIKDNLYWTYNINEDKDSLTKNLKTFIERTKKEFFPNVYISYDAILDGDFKEFINKNIDCYNTSFLFFFNKALYVYNNKKTIGINLESIRFVGLNVKKIITELLNELNCIILNYENFYLYSNVDEVKKLISINSIFWTKYEEDLTEKDFHKLLSDSNINKHIPYIMSILYKNELTEDEKISCLRQFDKDKITTWLSDRELFFNKNYNNPKLKFKLQNGAKSVKLNYSNKKTITGRINCADKFNPQNLPKDSEERKSIISRFNGGKIVMFDYVSFETKIALVLCDDNEFIEKYKDCDLHEENAKIIFQTNNITKEQRKIGKNINHAILYGGGDKKLKEILNELNNKEETLIKIKNFLKPIFEKSEYINYIYDEFGYVRTGMGTIIKPQKSWAVFNNYIQATAVEILINKLYEIKEFEKPFQSKFLFQVHDALLFDFHPDELSKIEEFREKISTINNLKFQVSYKIGNNLLECSN